MRELFHVKQSNNQNRNKQHISTHRNMNNEYLMKHLTQSGYTGDPVFQEQCLLASMWLKDHQYFWFNINMGFFTYFS